MIAASVWCFPAHGGPINSDVAFTPSKGGSIFRLQYSYSEQSGHGNLRHVNTSAVRSIYVYGLKENVALFFRVPYLNRQTDRIVPRLGRIEETHDGVGDLDFLVKFRFWQNDTRPGETYRWAAIGGLNIRSGDSDFSSDSYDPILGTVFTWRRDRTLLDAVLMYQFNTGGGRFRHDMLRYDLACSFRFFPVHFDPDVDYEWNAVAELNGRYTTDGSHEVFLSPGLQWVTQRWAIEASVQLPVLQELAGNGPETDYRLVVGVRFQW
ncbi:MAG: transporter [Planctomycetes bacterium]|nr:transporter [Planctomycetota bacterium]